MQKSLSVNYSEGIYRFLNDTCTSWHNQRKSQKPPHMLGLSDEEEFQARKLLSSAMTETLKTLLQCYASEFCDYELEVFNINYVNFFKYETGSSLGVHADTRPEEELNGNKFFSTVIFYFNDNYSGGKLNIYTSEKIIDIEISPNRGDIFIMKNSILHESTPVTEGNKYIAVMHWFNRKKKTHES